MAIELAVLEVEGGWRVFGPDFRSRLFDSKFDAVDRLLDAGQTLAIVHPRIVLLVQQAAELVPVERHAGPADWLAR